MCFFSNITWGMLLIIVGFVALINAIFNVHIPIFKIVFALFFIGFGIKILFGISQNCCHKFSNSRWSRVDECSMDGASGCSSGCCFSDAQSTKSTDTGECIKYSVVFGKKVIDLTGVEFADYASIIEINGTFSEVTVKIDSRMPIGIRTHVSFGSCSMPNSVRATFQNGRYETAAYENALHKIDLTINLTFGTIRIVDINKK